jgi:hypothetical protein
MLFARVGEEAALEEGQGEPAVAAARAGVADVGAYRGGRWSSCWR